MLSEEILSKIIRRRAALMISDLTPERYELISSHFGLEYYIYPALDHDYFSLGDIIQNRDDETQFRVIVTPHCYLITQPGQDRPRAEYILTVKTDTAGEVLGEKITNARANNDEAEQHDKLSNWAQSPAKTGRKPQGRHWYLPRFLKIPHLYCDFLQVESLHCDDLKRNYIRVATLLPPYAEAFQECFSSFYRTVGIAPIDTNSIYDLIVRSPTNDVVIEKHSK